jgi:hypothetical protein
MIRNVLRFLLLCPEGLSGRNEKEWDKEHQARLRSLGARVTSRGDCEAELTPTRATELLKLLRRWRSEGARVNGFGLNEELTDDDETPVEWFILDPTGHNRGSDGFVSFAWDLQEPILADDVHLKCRADRMKPGVHVTGWSPLLYVSEHFKEVVEANQLTGIEFVWCRDVGKYLAPQWFLPVCGSCLGRGVDHPWIDTAKLSGVGDQAIGPRGRHGQSSAFAEQYRRDAGPEDPVVKSLLRLLRPMELLKRPPDFDSFPRFLRKYLPDTDFAFTIEDMGGEGGYHARRRGLAMNRKARDVLKTNRIVTDDLCEPVMILNRCPKGVENLDRCYGPAERAFSTEQMVKIHDLETAAWSKHVANPKPRRIPDLARSLSLLRSRTRGAPKKFAKPATPAAISEAAKTLGVEVPAAWQKVLRVCNGGRIEKSALAADQACLIIPAEKLAKSRMTQADYYREIGAELPTSFLVVMETEIGDSVWLDTARQNPGGNCPVILMSHGTGEEEREWLTVADFLEELLMASAD